MVSYLKDINSTPAFGHDDYRRALIPSLLALYEEKSIGKALAAFTSQARSLWPEIPAFDCPASEASARVMAAQEFAARTSREFFAWNGHELSAQTGESESMEEEGKLRTWVNQLAYYRKMTSDDVKIEDVVREAENFTKMQ